MIYPFVTDGAVCLKYRSAVFENYSLAISSLVVSCLIKFSKNKLLHTHTMVAN